VRHDVAREAREERGGVRALARQRLVEQFFQLAGRSGRADGPVFERAGEPGDDLGGGAAQPLVLGGEHLGARGRPLLCAFSHLPLS
jgi:hypothetical protein